MRIRWCFGYFVHVARHLERHVNLADVDIRSSIMMCLRLFPTVEVVGNVRETKRLTPRDLSVPVDLRRSLGQSHVIVRVRQGLPRFPEPDIVH